MGRRAAAGRQIVPLDNRTLDRLPAPCRGCAFWELGARAPARGSGAACQQKAAWATAVASEWGPVGHTVAVDGTFAGYSLFAPARYLSQVGEQAARPVSRDAVLLATIAIEPAFTGQGLGRVLLQTMARDLTRRRVRAAEAFADRAWSGRSCYLPAGFLEASGFQVVREHPRFPLMRMDLRTALSWKDVADQSVQAALARLRARVPSRPALRPVPAGDRDE
jgi:GNAT superfamily N-acetyltransferase